MAGLLERKQTHFVFWRPGTASAAPPNLVIAQVDSSSPPVLINQRSIALSPSPLSTAGDLWEIAATRCDLSDGQVYHYWFEVTNTNVYPGAAQQRLLCTDPAAYCVDWRFTSTVPSGDSTDAPAPPAVIRFLGGQLVPTDPAAVPEDFEAVRDSNMQTLAPNNQLVIYELPTAWTRTGDLVDATHVGVGTFQDVLALVVKSSTSPSFPTIAVLAAGKSYLQDLGINALELLPPADTFADRRSWGYGTSNYFAPDFDLGRPLTQTDPTAIRDFLALIRGCHANGIRYFFDAVMAFAQHDPYRTANFLDFHVQFNAHPPDAEQDGRNGFGGDLWKYAYLTNSYDPVSGNTGAFYPGRQHMLTHMNWWMNFYHLDGYRLDSVNNVLNYDFVNQFRTGARDLWNARWNSQGNLPGGGNSRFLSVGEELSDPATLMGYIDALWNDYFRNRVRNAIVGRNGNGQPSFEWTVREMIDCRNLRDSQNQTIFGDGAQAVNYIGSHDVGNTDGDGTNNDRIYNFLDRFGVGLKDKPLKLAFVCLLTAVGIPMIFAGDEFADPMDILPNDPNFSNLKQTDPINYDLVTSDPWRASLFQYVANLVRFRTTAAALSVNDTEFIHIDFNDGKRVMAWQRGNTGQSPVVVVANFSDWGSDVSNPVAEYIVNNWPAVPAGSKWREVTQNRSVPSDWVGREPLYPWEAKVFTVSP
jgi:1,4-alpha-glucan branching enzyme